MTRCEQCGFPIRQRNYNIGPKPICEKCQRVAISFQSNNKFQQALEDIRLPKLKLVK